MCADLKSGVVLLDSRVPTRSSPIFHDLMTFRRPECAFIENWKGVQLMVFRLQQNYPITDFSPGALTRLVPTRTDREAGVCG